MLNIHAPNTGFAERMRARMSFVPDSFEPPLRLEAEAFVLEPLGPEHNESDYAAWTSSMEHIHASPGWTESTWPRAMTLDENRADLERHAARLRGAHAASRTPCSRRRRAIVIGCVYIYPVEDRRARRERPAPGSAPTAPSSTCRFATAVARMAARARGRSRASDVLVEALRVERRDLGRRLPRRRGARRPRPP